VAAICHKSWGFQARQSSLPSQGSGQSQLTWCQTFWWAK